MAAQHSRAPSGSSFSLHPSALLLSALPVLRHERRDAEVASALFHQFLEATPCPVPKLGLERNVARSQGAAFILAGPLAAAPLAATVIVHLAGMIAGRGTHTHSRAFVSTIRAFSAARIDPPANMRIGQQGILVAFRRVVRCLDRRPRRKPRQCGQRQFGELAPAQIATARHVLLHQSRLLRLSFLGDGKQPASRAFKKTARPGADH
jgi:hypothetical protein